MQAGQSTNDLEILRDMAHSENQYRIPIDVPTQRHSAEGGPPRGHGGPHYAPRPNGYHLNLNQNGKTPRRQSQLGHYSAGGDPPLGP